MRRAPCRKRDRCTATLPVASALFLSLAVVGCGVSGPLRVIERAELAPGATHFALLPLSAPLGSEKRARRARLEGAAARLTYRLREELSACGALYLVPQEAVDRALGAGGRAREGEPWEEVKGIGIRLGVDAVLVGALLSYVEREGGSFGARRPARVGFLLRLRRIPDGKELWRAEFEEAQKPLLEDITGLGRFIARGGRYQTADELAAAGARAAAESLCRHVGSHR